MSVVCVCVSVVSVDHFLSQEELRKFIKFACNQERIPFGNPCRDESTMSIPPYPMKIAPPDGNGQSVVVVSSTVFSVDTSGARECSEVSLFQRLKCMQEWNLGW